MDERALRIFGKRTLFPITLFALLLLPGLLAAQAPVPLQKTPGAAVAPKKAVGVDKDQAKAQLYQGVTVVSVQLWPANACEGTWQARIENLQDRSIGKAYAIPYQYSNATGWEQGPPAEFTIDKNQRVTVQGQWRQLVYGSEFKVAIKPAGADRTYQEKIIPLPHGKPSLVIERIEIGTNHVAVHIRNTGAISGCGLTVQMYKAKNSDPGAFIPAGSGPGNFPAGETSVTKRYTNIQALKSEWDLVQIVVFGENGERLAEKVFPLQ